MRIAPAVLVILSLILIAMLGQAWSAAMMSWRSVIAAVKHLSMLRLPSNLTHP